MTIFATFTTSTTATAHLLRVALLPAMLALLQLGLWQNTALAQTGPERIPVLTRPQAAWIAERIFANECNLKIPCLTSWNEGEDFPSLGIGHFIWFRAGQEEPFQESFPQLVAHYLAGGHAIPGWLLALPDLDSPWPDREAFLADLDSDRMTSLRNFLQNTQPVQAEFILARLYNSIPKLRAATDRPDAVEELFYDIASSQPPHSMYALIDYVNFKGEGTAFQERYRGQGWGLLQVLEHMLDHPDSSSLLFQFSNSAREILALRVANAPQERNESRWTAGWNNRVASYLP